MDSGGDGPPLLLLHGILVSSWAWRHNITPLSEHFRVIALCQKGFGWSGHGDKDFTLEGLAQFVTAFMDRLGLDRVHLAGNSLGGAVALHIAAHQPSRVGRLVLVDPAAVPFRFVTGFLALQFPVLTPVYRTFGHAAVFRLLLTTLAYRNTPIDSNYMHWFMAPLKQSTSIGSAVRVCRMLQRGLLELFPLLSHLSHPVLLVWGSHDRLIPLKAGLILNRTLPNSQLEIFRHCAHCAMEEDPERFNALAVNFLKVEPAA